MPAQRPKSVAATTWSPLPPIQMLPLNVCMGNALVQCAGNNMESRRRGRAGPRGGGLGGAVFAFETSIERGHIGVLGKCTADTQGPGVAGCPKGK